VLEEVDGKLKNKEYIKCIYNCKEGIKLSLLAEKIGLVYRKFQGMHQKNETNK
jgi:hypothetical protein